MYQCDNQGGVREGVRLAGLESLVAVPLVCEHHHRVTLVQPVDIFFDTAEVRHVRRMNKLDPFLWHVSADGHQQLCSFDVHRLQFVRRLYHMRSPRGAFAMCVSMHQYMQPFVRLEVVCEFVDVLQHVYKIALIGDLVLCKFTYFINGLITINVRVWTHTPYPVYKSVPEYVHLRCLYIVYVDMFVCVFYDRIVYVPMRIARVSRTHIEQTSTVV
jgi:hypothetical protein